MENKGKSEYKWKRKCVKPGGYLCKMQYHESMLLGFFILAMAAPLLAGKQQQHQILCSLLLLSLNGAFAAVAVAGEA